MRDKPLSHASLETGSICAPGLPIRRLLEVPHVPEAFSSLQRRKWCPSSMPPGSYDQMLPILKRTRLDMNQNISGIVLDRHLAFWYE